MKFFYFLLIILTTNLYSFDCSNKELKSLPILANGRVKPLVVHSDETIKALAGKKSINGKDSFEIYCELALVPTSDLNFNTKNEFLKNLLQLNNEIKFSALSQYRMELYQQLQQRTSKDREYQELESLIVKIDLYNDIKRKQDWMIPVIMNQDVTWKPIAQFSESDLENIVHDALKDKNIINPQNGIEYFYHTTHLTWIALLLSLIALMVGYLLKKTNIQTSIAIATLIIQALMLILRTMISGRAPLANMYESVLFTGFSALFIAQLVALTKKDKFILSVGLGVNILSLMMANLSTEMLDSKIGPLVPVLRSNFWLSSHVSTIIISYGAFALSWIVGNVAIIKKAFLNYKIEDEKYYNDLIYLCLKFGVVFLALGILLGAIWADYAWGRFWGWDPKETWSLIVMLIYMIIIHGKYTSWIPSNRFIHLTTAAFMSVVMAWFGVNYILASGLHSYGFRSGGTIFVVLFLLIQTLVLVATLLKGKAKDGR